MSDPTCVIVSDFNADNLRAHLASGRAQPAMQVRIAEYGQVMPVLLNPAHELWSPSLDLLVVWTRPELVSAEFARSVAGHPMTAQVLIEETDYFVDAIEACLDRARSVMIPLWMLAPFRRGLGISDFRVGGLSRSLHHMNHRLIERLADHNNVFIVAPEHWSAQGAQSQSVDKFWYAAKSPFTLPACAAAAEDARTVVRTVAGGARKLLVVDLDDTVWGGIVGDVGWEELRLGGHDPVGEAYKDFQQGLVALQHKGIAVAIVSKNDEAVALNAIDSHPEMLLKRDLLAGWRINWRDKATNIVELVGELNLGLDAVVFIDDNPAERGRVAEALPQVLVPDWPKDPTLYRHALERLTFFDAVKITDDDRNRTNSYIANRMRSRLQIETSSEEWVRSLDIKAELAEMRPDTRPRVVQLLNKTNQFNLTTRRVTEEELAAWLAEPNHQLFTVTVSDRFGELGLTGIISLSLEDGELKIVDFVLSCRAFGRSIENLLLSHAVDVAARSGAREVAARYLPTKKNNPTIEFLAERSHWREEPAGSGQFRWPAAKVYARPDFVTVTFSESAATCTLREACLVGGCDKQ
jgi:FkbH-like protein